MKAAGMLFLSRTPPALTKDSKGEWTVTLLCVDRIANHQVEPWKLIWKGQQAADWFDAHRARLLPGAVLCAVADNIRTHTMGRMTEITARASALWLVEKGSAA
jgi:hypothetical protein